MTFSVRDLAGQIGGDKDAAGRLAAAIAAAKSDVDELLDAFREMGVEGGATYDGLVATGERLELVERVRAEVEGGLEKARFIAMSAITGMHAGGGGGGGAVVPLSPAAVDDPSSWERPVEGGELLEPSETKGFRGLMNFMGKRSGDVADVAETSGKLLDIGWKSVGHEPTPTTGLTTSTEAHAGAKISAVQHSPKAGSGSLILATFLLTLAGTKVSEKAGNMGHRIWKARGNDNQ